MLKIWDSSLQKLTLAILMAGRKLWLQELQGVLQKITLLLPDVLTARNNVSGKLNVISSGCLSGGEVGEFIYFNHNPKSHVSLWGRGLTEDWWEMECTTS
jgi:hypothetical protein